MKRILFALATLAATLVPTVAHAQTPPNPWYPTTCYASSPVYGAYSMIGNGADIASRFVSGGDGTTNVLGQSESYVYVQPSIRSFWGLYGYECGVIGFPFTVTYRFVSGVAGQSYSYQYFIVPYSCSLHYIIAYDNGTIYAGTIPNYFCTGP